MPKTKPDSRLPSRALGALLFIASCSGNIESDTLAPHDLGASPHGAAPTGGSNDTTTNVTQDRTGPRRLSNVEYDNTARDLLGSKQSLAAAFVLEDSSGFDNVANGLGMSPSQFETYESAAESLAAELFADATRVPSVLSCNPSADDGGACLDEMLGTFGTRAFRRPLTDDDKTGLRKVYQAALGLGLSPPAARQQVLVAMLASPQFLYRVELDPVLGAPTSRPLDGYELASRLSFFLWSTLPDQTLFSLAAAGELTKTEVLRAQLTRMLADPRADTLIDNFAAQWLGLRELSQHKADQSVYPAFDDALRASMIQEAKLYFAEFLRSPRPLTEFLGASLNFVDARLVEHYGLTSNPGSSFQRIEQALGDRRGYLGLAAFLTLSSFSQRTSPTLRAKWVLEQLLCSRVPPPPPGVVADLAQTDAGVDDSTASENIRVRLEQHRSAPACAGCHANLDPIGLGMEGFDGIGQARSKYDNGDAVDTHGQLPTGEAFDGLAQLASVLVADDRFPRCAAQKLATYALGRFVEQETDLIDSVVKTTGAPTLSALIENIVLSDAFRQERASQP